MGWWYTYKSFVFIAKREEKKKHTLDNPYTYQCYLVKLTQRQLSQLSNYVLCAVGIVTHTQALQLLAFLVVVCNPVCSTRPSRFRIIALPDHRAARVPGGTSALPACPVAPARCLLTRWVRYPRAPCADLGALKQAKESGRGNFCPLVFGRQKSCRSSAGKTF